MESDDKSKSVQPDSRRPYVAPKVEESATFEHLVLSCGHNNADFDMCNKKKGGSLRS
ncbi:MAG: hypothetical protein ABW321_21780 [Polyangiales bacterium]